MACGDGAEHVGGSTHASDASVSSTTHDEDGNGADGSHASDVGGEAATRIRCELTTIVENPDAAVPMGDASSTCRANVEVQQHGDDAPGGILWARELEVPELEGQAKSALGLAATDVGPVVAVRCDDCPKEDTTVLAGYDRAGEYQWSKATNQVSQWTGLAADGRGFFGHGRHDGSDDGSYPLGVIERRDERGELEWRALLQGSAELEFFAYPNFVRRRVDGTIAVVGQSSNTAQPTRADLLFALLDERGRVQWQRSYNVRDEFNDFADGMALTGSDAWSALAVTGTHSGGTVGLVATIDTQARHCDAHTFDVETPGLIHSGKPSALLHPASGGVVLGGLQRVTAELDVGWVAAYDENFHTLWRRDDLGTSDIGTSEVIAALERSSGNIVVLTEIEDCLGAQADGYAFQLAELDREGHLLWSQLYERVHADGASHSLVPGQLALDPREALAYVSTFHRGLGGDGRVSVIAVALTPKRLSSEVPPMLEWRSRDLESLPSRSFDDRVGFDHEGHFHARDLGSRNFAHLRERVAHGGFFF